MLNYNYNMVFFWILWCIDALLAIILMGFFLVGCSDNTVSATNIGIWLAMIFTLAAVMIGSLWLKYHNYVLIAKVVAAIVAVPAFLYALFMAILIFSGSRWN